MSNDFSLRQRRRLANEIAKVYRAWKKKLNREPSHDERRQIVAIGFERAKIAANPALVDCVVNGNPLVTLPETVVMGPAGAVPMLNPSIAATMAGAVAGNLIASALSNPPLAPQEGHPGSGHATRLGYAFFGNFSPDSAKFKWLKEGLDSFGIDYFSEGGPNLSDFYVKADGFERAISIYENIIKSLRREYAYGENPQANGFWMNESEIDHAVELIRARAPQYLPYAIFLRDWKDIVNQNSDGWPYWRAGAQAAERLMVLISSAAKLERVSPADLKAALTPIKSIATRHKLPAPTLPSHLQGELFRNPRHEDDGDSGSCSYCGGPLGVLGQLGNRTHFQCRNCGAGFSSDSGPQFADPNGRRKNPLLMTVMGANPGKRAKSVKRGKRITISLQEFAQRVKSMNDPAIWSNFLAKIRGYQKWSHGTLPTKVTLEQVDAPGVSGLMVMYDAGRQPESTYIMPGGTKRKGAWVHEWESGMPEIKHDPEAGLVITKLTGKNKISDFYHR